MSDEPLCVLCSKLGKTCCQGTQVFLTNGDIKRISEACPKEDFVDFADPDRTNALAVAILDETWAAVLASGPRRVLRHGDGGDCHFLGETGCRLPMDTRPLICRLYPFEYDANTIKGVNPHLCPSPERNNAPLLLAMLGMNRHEAEAWRKMFYGELREDGETCYG